MIASVISPLLALLGVISCCGLPILAGILATLGIGASQLSFFAEYKGWFIGFIEHGENTYCFATNLQNSENATGSAASEITIEILNSLFS